MEHDFYQLLKKVRKVEILARKKATSAFVGSYRSAFRGSGMDFEEVRRYEPGDDVRHIDWNITAKMGKPFIKKFREERELNILIVFDISASGNFGSTDQTKRQYAAEIAATLATSALKNNDKVGLLLFSDQVEHFVPVKKGRKHIYHLIHEMLFRKPQSPTTNLRATLENLNRLLRRRAAVFLISDLIEGPGGWLNNSSEAKESLHMLSLVHSRHDLTILAVNDKREQHLPNIGIVKLHDPEAGQSYQVDTARAVLRRNYQAANAKALDELQSLFKRKGIRALWLQNGGDYIVKLQQYFNQRKLRVH